MMQAAAEKAIEEDKDGAATLTRDQLGDQKRRLENNIVGV